MSRVSIPLSTPDVSVFARSLARQLGDGADHPSHLEWLNMLARAAGFRNHQHLRAAHAARARLDVEAPPEPIDFRLIERTLRYFDADGRLLRWPSKMQFRELCLWRLWSLLPPAAALAEKDVNALLNDAHRFGDPALLRRCLVDVGLATRHLDGSNYRRRERRPPAEARELIRRLKERRATLAS